MGGTQGKVTTLAGAAALVSDGAHVALGGFAIARNATAFARELIRQGRRGLTLSQGICGLESDLLAGAGAVERLIYGADDPVAGACGSALDVANHAKLPRRVEVVRAIRGPECAALLKDFFKKRRGKKTPKAPRHEGE